jgi:hypothetical protein
MGKSMAMSFQGMKKFGAKAQKKAGVARKSFRLCVFRPRFAPLR